MKIIGNILGDMSGKLGKKIVAFTWKGIDVFRSYVVPHNPKSPDQTTQRNLFKEVISLAQSCLTTVIHPYWKAFAVGMSEFNAFVSKNLDALTLPFAPEDIVISLGKLSPVAILTAVYDDVTGGLAGTFDTALGTNGLATDVVEFFAYNTPYNLIVSIEHSTRTSGTFSATLDPIVFTTDFYIYAVASRDLGTAFAMVSNNTTLKTT